MNRTIQPFPLGLGAASRVLVFGTEGATDPKLYQVIVGRSAEAVAKDDR